MALAEHFRNVNLIMIPFPTTQRGQFDYKNQLDHWKSHFTEKEKVLFKNDSCQVWHRFILYNWLKKYQSNSSEFLLNDFNALWKWTLPSLIFLPHVCAYIITSHSHVFWIVNGWSKERAFTKGGESANTSLALIKFNRRTVHSLLANI